MFSAPVSFGDSAERPKEAPRELRRPSRQENGDKRIEPFFCPHSFVDWIGPVHCPCRTLFGGFGASVERHKEAPRELRRLYRLENGDNRIEPFFCPHSFVDWIEAALLYQSASWLGRASSRGRPGSNSGGEQRREREAVPPRLPSGWVAGLDLDRLRDVFREPEETTASGWKDAEVCLSDFCTLTLFPT